MVIEKQEPASTKIVTEETPEKGYDKEKFRTPFTIVVAVVISSLLIYVLTSIVDKLLM